MSGGTPNAVAERQANVAYCKIYWQMLETFGHDGMTMTTELDEIGNELFGAQYLGTFPQDRLPEKMYDDPSLFAIINVDTTGMPGTHWVAVAGFPDCDKILVFDSFGRASKTLLPTLRQRQVVDTDSDAEQRVIQESCGQFSMAWLVFVQKHGLTNAKLI